MVGQNQTFHIWRIWFRIPGTHELMIACGAAPGYFTVTPYVSVERRQSSTFLTWRFANWHDTQWLLLVLHMKHPFDPTIHEGSHYYRTQAQGLGL